VETSRNLLRGRISDKVISITLTITIDTTDGNVSSVEGIDPGMVVAADNFNKLTDGAKVMLRSAGGGGAGKGGWQKRNSQ
jgi:hypothetical protein